MEAPRGPSILAFVAISSSPIVGQIHPKLAFKPPRAGGRYPFECPTPSTRPPKKVRLGSFQQKKVSISSRRPLSKV